MCAVENVKSERKLKNKNKKTVHRQMQLLSEPEE